MLLQAHLHGGLGSIRGPTRIPGQEFARFRVPIAARNAVSSIGMHPFTDVQARTVGIGDWNAEELGCRGARVEQGVDARAREVRLVREAVLAESVTQDGQLIDSFRPSRIRDQRCQGERAPFSSPADDFEGTWSPRQEALERSGSAVRCPLATARRASYPFSVRLPASSLPASLGP